MKYCRPYYCDAPYCISPNIGFLSPRVSRIARPHVNRGGRVARGDEEGGDADIFHHSILFFSIGEL